MPLVKVQKSDRVIHKSINYTTSGLLVSSILNDASSNILSLCWVINVCERELVGMLDTKTGSMPVDRPERLLTIVVVCDDQARPRTTRMTMSSGAMH